VVVSSWAGSRRFQFLPAHDAWPRWTAYAALPLGLQLARSPGFFYTIEETAQRSPPGGDAAVLRHHLLGRLTEPAGTCSMTGGRDGVSSQGPGFTRRQHWRRERAMWFAEFIQSAADF